MEALESYAMAAAPPDVDSRDWLRSLRAPGRTGEEAAARLHALLLRAATFEVARRRPGLSHVRGDELDDIALEAAGGEMGPEDQADQSELLSTLRHAVADVLTPHQRSVLVALALDGVPIDVLAERLQTTRGALYKTLHDARRKLRGHLHDRGLAIPQQPPI
jgi:RNA polymerase sigma factor (sigma-70 family)